MSIFYPNWPDYLLPAPPLNDSYKITLSNNLVRTDFEQGLARQRNAFRSGVTQYAPTWPMTPVQFQTFIGIRRWLLADGNGWFNMPVFDGADYVTRLVRFVAGPTQPARDGGEWMVSAVMETLDDIAISNQDTAIALLTGGTDMTLAEISDLFHTVVHVDLRAALTP